MKPEKAIQHFLHYLSSTCNEQMHKIQEENINVEQRLATLLTVYHHTISKIAMLQTVNADVIQSCAPAYIVSIKHV
jgi:hypothetical protein